MRRFIHGHLGKMVYSDEFKELPKTDEEKRQELLDKMKPWKFDPKRPIFVGGKPSGDTPQPSVEVSILPSSAVQYENVILSASTTGTSAVFVWSLTDFYDTSGNTISSYTGQTLTEGYFSSTGSSNVSVSVVCDEGEGSTSTFSVSEFDPASTNPDLWYDATDVSTLTLRNDGTNDYVEAIENKGVLTGSTGMTLTQSVAAEQPLYSASTINGSLNVLYGDGVSNVLLADYGSVISSISGRTSFSVSKPLDKVGGGFPSNDGIIFFPINTLSREGRYLGIASSGTEILNNGSYNLRLRQTRPWSGDPLLYTWIRENNAGLTEGEYNGLDTWDISDSYSQPYNFRYVSIMRGNTPASTNDLYGEWGEWIHYHRTISDSDKIKIDRYLQYKWFGNQQY